MLPFRYLASLALWLTLWIPFYMLGFLVGWAGLLFCTRESEHLPWLWWPWDNSHGINGTLAGNNPKWVVLCNPEIRDLLRWLVDSQTGQERTYRKRWIWLFWRNPVSNLSLYPMGMMVDKPIKTTRLEAGPFVYEKVLCGAGWFYGLTFKYNAKRGFYHAFGWKFLDPAEGRARFMFRISPYRELT